MTYHSSTARLNTTTFQKKRKIWKQVHTGSKFFVEQVQICLNTPGQSFSTCTKVKCHNYYIGTLYINIHVTLGFW